MDRQPKTPQEVLPKGASNVWKSKREEEKVTKHDRITKDIRALLNKITSSTYNELAEEFIGYNVHTDPILLDKIVDLIFEKAVEEPRFCPLYSDLCKKQIEIESAQNSAAFRKALIIKCQKEFCEFALAEVFTHSQKPNEDVKGLERKWAEKKDVKAKLNQLREEMVILKCQMEFYKFAFAEVYMHSHQKFSEDAKGLKRKWAEETAKLYQLNEEIDTLKSKVKRRLLGIIRFIAQHYCHQLLTNQIITWCVVELVKQYEASSEDIYIEYAVQMVVAVGEVYEQRTATKQPPPQQPVTTPQPPKSAAKAAAEQSTPPPAQPQKSEIDIDTILAHFATLKPRMTNRVRFMIMNLEELRTQSWKMRGGDKGPKTVKEVQNVVEQEVEEVRDEVKKQEQQVADDVPQNPQQMQWVDDIVLVGSTGFSALVATNGSETTVKKNGQQQQQTTKPKYTSRAKNGNYTDSSEKLSDVDSDDEEAYGAEAAAKNTITPTPSNFHNATTAIAATNAEQQQNNGVKSSSVFDGDYATTSPPVTLPFATPPPMKQAHNVVVQQQQQQQPPSFTQYDNALCFYSSNSVLNHDGAPNFFNANSQQPGAGYNAPSVRHPPIKSNPLGWNCEQVATWISSAGYAQIAQKIFDEEVDGEGIVLFDVDTLRQELGLKLGIAVKVMALVKELRLAANASDWHK